MTPRPCLQCGTPSTNGARCPRCESAKQAKRNATRVHYHGDWRTLAKRTVDAWVTAHGETCPGWGVPPHPAPRSTLCCDHVEAGSRQALAVLCRACNGRKGSTVDKQHRHG